MTQLGKSEHLLLDAHDGAELADLAALAATGAFLLVNLWDRQTDRLCRLDNGLEEQVTVRLLYIAVQQLNLLTFSGQTHGQVCGQGRLTRASLSGGDGYDHIAKPLILKGPEIHATGQTINAPG